MNKLKRLIKRLTIEAAVVAAIVAGVGGIMMLTGNLATSATEKKAQAENTLNQDNGQLNSLKSQLDRSGEAEKRFVDIQLNHLSADYSSNTDGLKEWLREAKSQYRFGNNFKLNLPPAAPTDKTELSGLSYDVAVRNNIILELTAISDVHVYSFIEDMKRSAPGLIRITGLNLERVGDLDPTTVAQMMGGIAPNLVNARITFSWIGISPKEQPATATTSTAPAAGGATP